MANIWRPNNIHLPGSFVPLRARRLKTYRAIDVLKICDLLRQIFAIFIFCLMHIFVHVCKVECQNLLADNAIFGVLLG